jgi:hypothetical protein
MCDKVFSHDSVRSTDGNLIAAPEIAALKVGLVDHDFSIQVPTAERELSDLRAMCTAEESYVIHRQEECFILGASIGLSDWRDAVSLHAQVENVVLTRYSNSCDPVVHEFWRSWNGIRVEAR